MNEDYAKCPHCDEYLVETNSRICDAFDDTTIFIATGFCPKCGKKYEWQEYYDYKGFEYLREV